MSDAEATIKNLGTGAVFAITEPRQRSYANRFARDPGRVTSTYRVIDVIGGDATKSTLRLATLDGQRVTRSWRNTAKVEIMTPTADELAILWK